VDKEPRRYTVEMYASAAEVHLVSLQRPLISDLDNLVSNGHSRDRKNSEWAQFQYFAYGRYSWRGITQNQMKSGEGTVNEKKYFTE